VKLRARLVMILLITVVPLGVGVSLLEREYRLRSADESVAEGVIARMQAGGRDACEENPQTWPRRGPRARRPDRRPEFEAGRRLTKRERRARRRARRQGLGRPERQPTGPRAPLGRIVAYSANFETQGPRAPRFPDALREPIRTGEPFASFSETHPRGSGRHRVVAVRMPWTDGPCAIITIARPASRAEGLSWSTLVVPVTTSAVAILIVLLAAGPLVRRTRKLAEQIRAGSASPATSQASPISVGGSDELSEVARAFEERRREIQAHISALEARDRALRDYVANTTHDLMVPITVLQGHLASMRGGADEGTQPDRAVLTRALEEAHYLASLVHNLNVAAKLEAGGTHLLRGLVNANELVERVVARHRPIARERGIKLEYGIPDSPVHLVGDVTLLEQAVSNVVHNAVRYNRPQGNVAVLLERDGPDRFVLRVIDDGPGVTEEELARLVERRFRSDDARQRNLAGSGLGLAISHDVAERHQMRLVISRPAKGGLSVEFRGPRNTQ